MNSELENFESELKKLALEGKLKVPLSDDLIEFLFEKAEPIKPSENLVSELGEIILRSMKDRIQEESEEINGSTTFGEYISNLEAKLKALLGIDQIKEYLPETLTEETVKRIKSDQLDKVSVADVASCIRALLISFKVALTLLERSFRVMDLRKKGLVFSSNARIQEQPNTAARYKTTMSSMQKLLLSLDEEKKLTDVEKDWSEFKHKLEQELKSSKYI